MFILESGCGWIPDAPINFMSNIIDIIKVLTPVYLVIMGSIGFGKAIISQKEDEIKKAQAAFIKKIIAGAAVFFVIIFAEWITNLITKVGGDASGAMSCVNALLNGTYSADDKDYYDPSENTTAETYEICTNKCNQLDSGMAKTECQKHCDKEYGKTNTEKPEYIETIEKCLENKENLKYYNTCISNTLVKNADGSINYEETVSKLNDGGGFYSVNYQNTVNSCTSAIMQCAEYVHCMDNLRDENNGKSIELGTDPCRNLQYDKNYDKKGKCEKKYNNFNKARNKINGQFPDPDEIWSTIITDDMTNYCKTKYADKIWKGNLEKTVEAICIAEVCPN